MGESERLAPNEAQLDPSFYNEKDSNNREIREKIIEEGGMEVGGVNVTEGDLFFIPSGIDEKKLVELLKEKFEVDDVRELDMEKISEYLQNAKKFAQDYLLIRLPNQVERMGEIKNISQLLNLLKKTRALKRKRPSMLSPYYCALSFVALAEKEFDKREMGEFIAESEYLYERLFDENEEGETNFHRIASLSGEEYDRVGIFTGGRDWINAKIGYRGKEKDSVIAKLVRDPEINADELIRDSIGLKFEVEGSKDAAKLINFLAEYLEKNFKTESLRISDIGFLSEDDREVVFQELEELGVETVNTNNPATNKNYRALKIEGKMRIKKGGKKDAIRVSRNFEIQIVSSESENEKGFANHHVYRGVQKLSTYSRLFGTFSEVYLIKICQEVSKKSGIGVDKVKRYILDNFLSVIENRGKKGNVVRRYGPTKQLDRLKKAELLPKSLEYKSAGNGRENK